MGPRSKHTYKGVVVFDASPPVLDARVIGFDIDLTHFRENRDFLVSKGAFTKNEPELQEYDQLVDGSGRLQTVLCDSKLDVVIDDGLHSIEAIVTPSRSVHPFLAAKFVYFIEDYGDLLESCSKEFDGYDRCSFGMLTVISRGLFISDC